MLNRLVRADLSFRWESRKVTGGNGMRGFDIQDWRFGHLEVFDRISQGQKGIAIDALFLSVVTRLDIG